MKIQLVVTIVLTNQQSVVTIFLTNKQSLITIFLTNQQSLVTIFLTCEVIHQLAFLISHLHNFRTSNICQTHLVQPTPALLRSLQRNKKHHIMLLQLVPLACYLTTHVQVWEAYFSSHTLGYGGVYAGSLHLGDSKVADGSCHAGPAWKFGMLEVRKKWCLR